MIRDPLVLLEYEAKRKPALASLIADLDSLTEEAIAAAKVLPWIRKALLTMKRQRQSTDIEAEVMACTIVDQMPDPLGEMRRWEGPEEYVKIGRTQLEMRLGQLLWLDANGVWIDTIHTPFTEQISRNTTSCGLVRRTEYMQAVRQRAQQLVPQTATPTERFRIYRPAG
jgi:hypothetical protein